MKNYYDELEINKNAKVVKVIGDIPGIINKYYYDLSKKEDIEKQVNLYFHQ